MKNFQTKIKYLFILLLAGISFVSYGQTDTIPPDPGSLYVYKIQDMAFGAFSHGVSGGTVIISTTGTRSVTGSITPLNMGVLYYQAIFETAAPAGAIISLLNGPDATLTGSNGGTLLMHIGGSSPGSPFVNTVPSPGRTSVSVGGTLTVGSAISNPPGLYTGMFYIIFSQE